MDWRLRPWWGDQRRSSPHLGGNATSCRRQSVRGARTICKLTLAPSCGTPLRGHPILSRRPPSAGHVDWKTMALVYREYGVEHHQSGAHEIDHLISLGLGGSNDIRDLWPENLDTQP